MCKVFISLGLIYSFKNLVVLSSPVNLEFLLMYVEMRTPISCRAQTSGGRRAQTGNSTIIGRLEMCALSPPAAAEDRDIIVTADNCLLFDDDDDGIAAPAYTERSFHREKRPHQPNSCK